jgi:H+/Cl- antiporter ClcA
VLATWKLPLRLAGFLQIFLGVATGLNALRDLATLYLISTSRSDVQSDAQNMSHLVGLPSAVWATLWALLAVLLVATSLVVLVKRDFRPSRRIPDEAPLA